MEFHMRGQWCNHMAKCQTDEKSHQDLTCRIKCCLFANLDSLNTLTPWCMHCHLLLSVHLQYTEHYSLPLKRVCDIQ